MVTCLDAATSYLDLETSSVLGFPISHLPDLQHSRDFLRAEAESLSSRSPPASSTDIVLVAASRPVLPLGSCEEPVQVIIRFDPVPHLNSFHPTSNTFPPAMGRGLSVR